MPTVITTTIGATSSPITPDFTSLQAWEDALPVNLVTADEQHIGECLDQGEFFIAGGVLVIAGQTTDATRNIILRCATGASFKHKAGVRTTALDYNASNGVAIRSSSSYVNTIQIDINNVLLDGLQVKAGATAVIVDGSGTTTVTLDSCVLFGGGWNGALLNVPKIVNTVVHASTRLTSNGSSYYGCTIIGPGSGAAFGGNYSTVLIKNIAVFNFASLESSANFEISGSSEYCASDLASIPGTNHQTSLTFADQFENSTNDFRAKSTGDLQAGTPDATNTPDDITGLTRDATTPWIGCWEVAGGGGGGTILPFVNNQMYAGAA